MDKGIDPAAESSGVPPKPGALELERDAHQRLAEKMEAVGMLAGGVAHELNNILSGILGFTSYLMAKSDPGTDLYRDLTLIDQSGTRAADLTRQLLSFARRRHFPREPISLNPIVEQVLGTLGSGLPSNIRVQEDLARDLPPILGNREQLADVIRNLCLNAQDAMAEKGGAMTLVTERRQLTPRERAVLLDARDGDYVCLSVRDTGCGMDPEALKHVFDPFYTTKFPKGGVGLGMAMVYGVVSNHHGDILVESAEGEGATFRLYFPAHGEEAPRKEAAAVRQLEGTEAILLIDDEPIVRQVTTEILKAHGYQVVAAASGEEGVGLFRELAGRVHLVILDLIMPGMGGEATFKELRKIRADMPVLLSSGYAQEEVTQRLSGLGVRGMVYKPFKADQLLTAIRSALNQEPA
ncbi:MAG: response regulator [Verrucomicrobiota bacterium]